MFAIVANKARTRAVREGTVVLLDDLQPQGEEPDPDRFDQTGHWRNGVEAWNEMSPERLAGNRELLRHLGEAMDALPPLQRAVVMLRDVEGLDGPEACNILGVSESNLRVLLHRARTRLRGVLEGLVTPKARRPGQG
jgi:RNA polymerase sigma-70 factor (ECF subfamily)